MVSSSLAVIDIIVYIYIRETVMHKHLLVKFLLFLLILNAEADLFNLNAKSIKILEKKNISISCELNIIL